MTSKDKELADYIRSRCVEDGDCLIWQGPVSHAGVPVMDTRQKQSVRKALYEATKRPALPDMVFPSLCENQRCICHTEPMTRGEARKAAAAKGAYRNPARVLRRTMTARAKSRYGEEVIEAIRGAETAAEAIALTGVSVAYAYEIRSGKRRAPISTPFYGLGARA